MHLERVLKFEAFVWRTSWI